nr:hypothetical protein [Baekduia soli]
MRADLGAVEVAVLGTLAGLGSVALAGRGPARLVELARQLVVVLGLGRHVADAELERAAADLAVGVLLDEVLGALLADRAARDPAADDVGGREREVALLDARHDRVGEVEQPQRLARPLQRRADQARDLRGRELRVLAHDGPRGAGELHGLGAALVEVLGELHRERLAARDVVDEREPPLAVALGGVQELHRAEAAAAGQQLVGLVVLAGGSDERWVQQAGLLDGDRQLMEVRQRAGAHVDHRAHLSQARRDRAVLLGCGGGQGSLAQVGVAGLALGARCLLAQLRDLFFGVLELVDLGHGVAHRSRRPGGLRKRPAPGRFGGGGRRGARAVAGDRAAVRGEGRRAAGRRSRRPTPNTG